MESRNQETHGEKGIDMGESRKGCLLFLLMNGRRNAIASVLTVAES
jgi:hypothetical protein